MPVGRRFDFQLNGLGYILARQAKGRSWERTGVADTPSRRSSVDAKYGELPDEVDHPEVWDDWSAGMGFAYRRNGEPGYHWAENFDARNPRQLVHAQSPVNALATFSIGSGREYMLESVDGVCDAALLKGGGVQDAGKLVIFGRHGWIAATPTGTTTPTARNFVAHQAVADLAGTSASLQRAVTFGSFIYFGQSNPSGFYAMNATGFLGLSINMSGYRFAVAGNQLWRAYGDDAQHAYGLRNCAVAGNTILSESNWGPSLNIGNLQSPIKDLIALDDQVFAGKDEGLYAGDSSGTFVNVLSDLEGQIHQDNCRDLTVWQNSVIAQHAAGVFAYQPSSFEARVEDITPPVSSRSPIRGHIRTVMGYGRYLYAGMYTNSASWLLCGERRGEQMAWHTLQRFPEYAKISRLHIDGIGSASSGTRIPNRFWAATDASIDTSGTAPLYYWNIPQRDGNPLYPGPTFTPNYMGSARIDLGNVDWGAPSTPKVFRSVEVWADSLLSGYRYADIYYAVDQTGSFSLLGRVQDSPKSTLYFTASPSFITGQSIELSLQSFTASPVYAPVYRAIVLRGALRPSSVDQITAVVKLADGMKDRQNAPMRSAAAMITELRALAKGSVPVVLIDLAGATSYVNVLPPIQEHEMYQKGSENPELAVTIKMSVMTFSP